MKSRTTSDRKRPSAQKLCVLLAVAMFIGRVAECEAAPPNTVVESSNRIVITLRAPGRIASSILRVADVADLRGGDEAMRQRIAALDLEDATLAGAQTEITPLQIEFRLRVAGIDPQRVAIRGSTARVTTSPASAGSGLASSQVAEPRASALFASHSKLRSATDAASNDSEIERAVLDAAQKCLSKQLPWPDENVVVQLAQPLPRELRERTFSTAITVSAELRTPGTPLGRVALRVTIKAPGQRTLDVPVQLDVRHFEDVVVTTKPVTRGHVFSAADLKIGRQDVTLLSGYCTSLDQLVGQQAKRVFPESQLLRAVDVEPESRVAGPPLVKRRDRVKASARSGVLLVTIVGEAQQDGRVGELIKIKNVDSNTFIYGRVVSATEVEITE